MNAAADVEPPVGLPIQPEGEVHDSGQAASGIYGLSVEGHIPSGGPMGVSESSVRGKTPARNKKSRSAAQRCGRDRRGTTRETQISVASMDLKEIR